MKLELYWPTKKPFYISQRFDEDKTRFNKEFGMKGHGGIDLYHAMGAFIIDFPLYSPIDGEITYIENDVNLGLGIVIKSLEKYLYEGKEYYFKLRLWHLAKNSIVVRLGQQVKIGDYLGMADNTGFSTGTHLHIDGKPLNDDGSNAFQSNGYFGAVDIEPYFQAMTAYEVKTNLSKIAEMIESLGRQISEFIKRRK